MTIIRQRDESGGPSQTTRQHAVEAATIAMESISLGLVAR